MRIIATSTLLLVLVCGCVSQKQLNERWERESGNYYLKYCQAESPQAAIDALNDYLHFVDNFELKKAIGPRYSFARALTECRISMIYEQLGNKQASQAFMGRAVEDAEKDKYVDKTQDKQVVEADLRQTVEKINGWHTIEWQKAPSNAAPEPTAK